MPYAKERRIPLGMLGRAQSIDLEEPPDIDDVALVSDNHVESDDFGESYYYRPEHANETARTLTRSFKTLHPGCHVIKRSPRPPVVFGHCRAAIQMSYKYKELQLCLATRARLQWSRECLSRIQATSKFVKDLQKIIQEEYRVWYELSRDRPGLPPALTRLEGLGALCEELRIHMGHWNALKQLCHTNEWLRPFAFTLARQMEAARFKLIELCRTAAWWIDKLIRIGLRVLAHCAMDDLTDSARWSIARGLEDFNSIITALNASTTTSFSIQQDEPSTFLRCHGNHQLGAALSPIPILEVLQTIANERAAAAADMTHEFFTCNSQLHHLLQSKRLLDYSWSEELKSRRPASALETSDYHTGSGSHVSLSTVLLRVGNMIAPDLSKQESPLVAFVKKEHKFVRIFLQIVSHATALLYQTTSNAPKSESVWVICVGSERVDDTDSSRSSTASNSSKRKAVSWSDASQMTIITQLAHQYIEFVWQQFAREFFHSLRKPAWRSPELGLSRVGSLVSCPDVVVMLVIKMMKQTCVKDIFPVGCVLSLLSVAQRLRVTTAWAAWDHAFCAALASQLSDKCQATPLVNAAYSTATAKLLRDAYQPLHNILATLDNEPADDDDRKEEYTSRHRRQVVLMMLLPTLHRLLVTSDLAAKWCAGKSRQFLSSWALGPFLLVTLSDVKLLADEMRRSLVAVQLVCPLDSKFNTQSEKLLLQHIAALWQQLNDVTAHLQAVSGKAMKRFSAKFRSQAWEFLENNMPVGKVWQDKSSREFPTEPSTYVKDAMSVLLDPVIKGVSKLPSTSQLSAIPLAVTALGEAWTDYILKTKIKFSIHGAVQLQQDFHFTHSWLDDVIDDTQVKQSTLALDIFRYQNAVGRVLQQQPGKVPANKVASYQPSERPPSMCCQVGVHSVSPEHWGSIDINESSGSSGHAYRTEATSSGNGRPVDRDSESIPHLQQWQALRLQGRTRSWLKLPICF